MSSLCHLRLIQQLCRRTGRYRYYKYDVTIPGVKRSLRNKYTVDSCTLSCWHTRVMSRGSHNLQRSPRLLFFGTDQFSCHILQTLCDHQLAQGSPQIQQLDVVCPSQKCIVYKFAVSRGMKTIEWPLAIDLRDTYDLGVVASFGHMIPASVIESFPCGILNIHPSLLPRWRGSAPIVYTILHGDEVTGVSIMQIHPHRFDTGPILLQQSHRVTPGSDAKRLSDELSALGGHMLLTVLGDLDYYRTNAATQDHTKTTYAKKLKSHVANVNWARQTVDEVSRQSRALYQHFTLRTEYHGRPVKLHSMTSPSPDLPAQSEPGVIVFCHKCGILNVRCQDGWVAFEGVVLRKPMSGRDFYNGHLSKVTECGRRFTSLDNGHCGSLQTPRMSQQPSAIT